MNTQFGSIRVIPGEGGSRFPYCTSLFIDDDVKVLIDPGAGLKSLNALKQDACVDIVVNTHYHYDHISCNHLFEESRIIINEEEAQCYRDRKFLAMNLGMEEVYGQRLG
jgi:hydroxyacylglutathione hydrolase